MAKGKGRPGICITRGCFRCVVTSMETTAGATRWMMSAKEGGAPVGAVAPGGAMGWIAPPGAWANAELCRWSPAPTAAAAVSPPPMVAPARKPLFLIAI